VTIPIRNIHKEIVHFGIIVTDCIAVFAVITLLILPHYDNVWQLFFITLGYL